MIDHVTRTGNSLVSFVASVCMMSLMGCGGGGSDPVHRSRHQDRRRPHRRLLLHLNLRPLSPASLAKTGKPVDFACQGISLGSHLTNDEMGGEFAVMTSGVGMTPRQDREYALMGMRNGTAFVDVYRSRMNAIYIGRLPSETVSSFLARHQGVPELRIYRRRPRWCTRYASIRLDTIT